eukprot:5936547-Pleurochrysis_carterae.AAC.1
MDLAAAAARSLSVTRPATASVVAIGADVKTSTSARRSIECCDGRNRKKACAWKRKRHWRGNETASGVATKQQLASRRNRHWR